MTSVVGLKTDPLVKFKSNETTSNLRKDVRNNVRHGNLASSSHHNRSRGVKMSARNVTAKHNRDG